MKNILAIIFVIQIFNSQTVSAQKLLDTNTQPVTHSAPRKFIHITEFGFLLGKQAALKNYGNPYSYSSYYSIYPYPYYAADDQYSNFTFQHFTGYNVHKAVALGITGGFDYYRSNIITPLSIGIRSTLLPSRRISPIANIDAGYGFIWQNSNDKNQNIDKQGGIMINPSAGLRIKLGDDGSSISINVGYKIQKSEMKNNQPEQQYYMTEYRSFERLSVRIGVGF
jgi:hypothetical protein